ncbi:MAG TPA: TIGR04076 family protein [Dehalococcoidales bacterium]
MDNWYKVKAKVVSQKGHCEAGLKVGDEFIIGDTTPAGICTWAFYTLFPFISALQSGGVFPWEKDKDTTTAACVDSTNPVVFELKRIK